MGMAALSQEEKGIDLMSANSDGDALCLFNGRDEKYSGYKSK